MGGWLGSLFAAALLAGLVPGAVGQGIYTCVDAQGRRLTSDRPIIDCIDREQREITPSGQTIRKLRPSLTPEEVAAEEEKQRQAMAERNRQLEEKRRDRALLARYPDKATHDKERAQAIASIDEAIRSARQRIGELGGERKKIDLELEFYKGEVAKAPTSLKRRIEDNEQSIAAQERFIATKEDEKKRTHARYDEELSRLRTLWVPAATASSQAAKR